MSDRKSFLDDIAQSQRPESFSQEKFVSVGSGGKAVKAVISAAVIIVLAAAVFMAVSFMSRIEVPELVGMDLADAAEWAAGNKIILSAKSVYDFDNEEGVILSQAIEAGKKINKNSTIPIQISLGADPEEQIVFPDIKSMTAAEIDEWISENKLTGARTETAYSDVVASGSVISYSFTDGSEDSFKRKNRVVITLSNGPEELSETVVVPDFTSYKTGALLQWGDDNGIEINLIDEFDEHISSGSVISQSVKTNTEVKRGSGITVLISAGKAVVVPDFSIMSKDETDVWAKLNNISIITIDKYSDTFRKGVIFSQETAPGGKVSQGGNIVVNVSLGRVEIGSYIGKTRPEILSWQDQVNANSAGIDLVFSEDFGTKGSFGKIISQSIRDDLVNTGSSINITISKGMKVITPDFSGKKQDECMDIANDAGISLIFDYMQSDNTDKDYVISQTPLKGTVITDNETIRVVISLTGETSDKITVADFSSMKKDSIVQWGVSNGANIDFREEFNEYISAGSVISQSVAKNSVIKAADYIEVVISAGPAVTIPDLSLMSEADASLWAKTNNISITFNDKYSNIHKRGVLFGQSQPAGASVGENSNITCNCSLGLVEVTDFIGKTKLDILNWQAEVNGKGADIRLSFTEGYGDKGTAGTIMNQSVKNDIVYTGSTIDIVISLGKQLLTPGFLGIHESACATVASNAGVNIILVYEYSDTVIRGYVIRQSYDKDSIITDATVIMVTVSNGAKPE
ncbi:MAG: PASTA domain-containing protein [Eubacteriales bacterium]|nr:PASTA domain-containing protein [Eubacteriales bacterium]